MTDDPLQTPDELSKFLRDVPVRTLARWRWLGEGPRYVRLGKHIRYRHSDVILWINSRVQGNDPDPRQSA